MRQLIWLIGLGGTIYLLKSAKKQVPDGTVSEESLTGQEKVKIWILCLLDPILAGAIFYYGWKKKLPKKGKQANQISLWAFFIEMILYAIFLRG